MISGVLLFMSLLHSFHTIIFPSSRANTVPPIIKTTPTAPRYVLGIATPSGTILPTSTKQIKPTKKLQITPKKIRSAGIKTTDPLLIEINAFRNANQKQSIVSHELLCTIAKKRIDELITRGKLDNHEGFQKYTATIQQSFHQWWEVIYWGSPPREPHEVVFTGWAQSQGHHDAVISNATHGCGKTSNGFAVFILGRK